MVFCYNECMLFTPAKLSRLKVFCVPITLLIGALLAALLAFPALARMLLEVETPMAHRLFPVLCWVCLGVIVCGFLQWQVFRDLRNRRWVGALFHLGVLVVLIGGGLTAVCAQSQRLPMALPPSAPMVRVGENHWEPLDQVATEAYMLPEWRMVYIQGRWRPLYAHIMDYLQPADFQHWAVAEHWGRTLSEPILPGTGTYWEGSSITYDRVTLEAFTTETYPNGMPSQYRTKLCFNDNEHYELSVNDPLRRKGLTYYQMNTYMRYIPAVDGYGNPVYFKVLAVDEKRNPRFDEHGEAIYYGEQGEYPVEYLMTFTELDVRSDPGAPVTFVGYGLLALAALGLALREERRK